MSRQGIAATQHLFGGHCTVGAKHAAEVTRTEADLRTIARKLARQPERRTYQNELVSTRAKRDDARAKAEQHLVECQTCADHRAEREAVTS